MCCLPSSHLIAVSPSESEFSLAHMRLFALQTVFEKEVVLNILKEVTEETLHDQTYNQGKVRSAPLPPTSVSHQHLVNHVLNAGVIVESVRYLPEYDADCINAGRWVNGSPISARGATRSWWNPLTGVFALCLFFAHHKLLFPFTVTFLPSSQRFCAQVALGKPFKYIVSCVIMQKNGAGMHTCSSCFWDNANDGSASYKYPPAPLSEPAFRSCLLSSFCSPFCSSLRILVRWIASDLSLSMLVAHSSSPSATYLLTCYSDPQISTGLAAQRGDDLLCAGHLIWPRARHEDRSERTPKSIHLNQQL